MAGAAVGGAIAAATGLSITSRMEHIAFDWQRMGWIALVWAIGWIIGRYFQINFDQGALGWTIGAAVAAAVGGFMTIWQLLKMKSL